MNSLLAVSARNVFARHMDDTKPWYQSKTIWGAVIAAAAFVLNLFHINIADLTSPLVDSVVGLIGVIVAIFGRVAATKVIGPATASTARLHVTPLIAAICIGLSLSSCANFQADATKILNSPEVQAIISQAEQFAIAFAENYITTHLGARRGAVMGSGVAECKAQIVAKYHLPDNVANDIATAGFAKANH